jgi:iron complex outermembrane receptor protein
MKLKSSIQYAMSGIILASVGMIFAPTSAAAQEPSVDNTIEEIIVSARKRDERLQDVPIAVSAVTGDAMQFGNKRSIGDIAAVVPGLNINSDTIGRAFVSIRGIGTALQAGVQPGVGLFLDGVYQPYTSFVNSPTLDVARVEVLRGPQGTLYGKNTLGGAINVITVEPSAEFEGSVYATGSFEDESMEAGARLSGPLGSDRVRGRIALSQRDADGFYRNDLIGGDVTPIDSTNANAGLQIDATDNITVVVNGYWQELEGGGSYSAVEDERDYRSNVLLNVLNRTEFTYEGLNGRIEVAMPSINTTMTAIAAYDSRETDGVSDGDFLPLDVVRSAVDGKDETTTGELRFDTEYSERFSTLIGLYASREETDAATAQTVVANGLVATSFAESTGETWSIFGTAIWRLADDLELSAGLRYDEEDRERSSFQTLSVLPGVEIPDPPQSLDSEEWEPRVSLIKFLRDELTIYGSISKGYRGGGFNSAAVPPEFSTYDGDTVWTYEIGTKGVYNEGRTYFAAAVYYNDYTDFIGQNALALGPGGGLVSIDLNLGDVESYGLEFEGSYRVNDNWRLGGSVTLMHARITDQSGWLEVTGAPLATDRLLFQPDWNFNLDSDVTVPLGDGTLIWNLNISGKGSRPGSSFDPVTPSILDEYYLVNTTLVYDVGHWEISAFATNLTDEEYWESYIDGSLLGTLLGVDQSLAILGAPTNYGLRVRYDF